MTNPTGRRTIHLGHSIFGSPPRKPVTVARREPKDFPHVPRPVLDMAVVYTRASLLGPPLCAELVELIAHVFTEEEASVARHLGLTGDVPSTIARAEHRPVQEIEPILERLSRNKGAIWAAGAGARRRYGLLPLVPGMFELIMVRQRLETLSDWHRRYLELFEALHETGYSRLYTRHEVPVLRFLPVSGVLPQLSSALPSDKLEVVLDRYQSFALTQCQCRLAMRTVGAGCDRPLDCCMALGGWAEAAIDQGLMRRIGKQDALALKREAESAGCVSWVVNMASAEGQASCSCCGCCCHVMRWMREFDAPAIFAPPHFQPRVDQARCSHCGACARSCPMGAMAVDPVRQQRWWLAERCIGCGLCALACKRAKAIEMAPVPDYRLPPESWLGFALRAAPGIARTAWDRWRERRLETSWWPR